jgi:hypothetical protein
MGRPRARTHPAHTLGRTHTPPHARTLAPTRQSSIKRKAHIRARLLPALSPARTTAPSSRPPLGGCGC